MKNCSKCHKDRDLSEFYMKGKTGKPMTYCKECFNQYCIDRWIQKKKDAVEYKGGECVDCLLKTNHYCVYEFHHINPQEKDYDWNKLRLKSQESINKELDKCVLLCANCHRIRHSRVMY